MTFSKTDYQEAKKFFKINDNKIYQILKKNGYQQPPPERNLFATLVGSIIGQKIRFYQARKIRGNLYTAIGNDDFSSSDIINLGKNGLIKTGMESNISDLIYNLSSDVEFGNVTINNINDIRQLNYMGIGPWTKGCTIVMYCLHHSDEFYDGVLFEDLIIRRGMKQLYDPKLTKKQAEIIGHGWKVDDKDWRSIAVWYLWKEFT